MRRFELCMVVFAMNLSLFLTACGNSPSFDRAAALSRIETRLAEEDAWLERYRPLSDRKRAGEDVQAEIKAIGERPEITSLMADAEGIVEANPADDAAFLAIEVALRANQRGDLTKWSGSENEARQQRLTQILIKHHIQRADFRRAVFVYFTDPQQNIAFRKQVLESSPHREVRADAAVALVHQYFTLWSQPDRPAAERQNMRQELEHYAQLVRTDYADVGDSLSVVEKRVAALNYSVGATLPDVAVNTVSGGSDSLKNYQGKVVLLDFWATWCSACRKDHPKLMALKQELAGKSFEIISISVDETPELVTKYLAKEFNLPWPQWHVGPESELLKSWGVPGFPTYFLLDAEGVVQARGPSPHLDAIKDHARKLVAETTS